MGNDLERLAHLVRQRRLELGLGIEPAARLAGMSKDTWKKVEAARDDLRATSYTGIERALRWAPGSCTRVLEGGEPVPVAASSAGGDAGIAVIPKEELRRQVGDSVNSAAIGFKGDLTADQILDLNRLVLDELHKRGVF